MTTVVVIEDEAPIADAVAARLRSEGFDVEVASDGPSGEPRGSAGDLPLRPPRISSAQPPP